MFRWRFIKQFPKIALILGVLVLSTGMFGYWWYFKRSHTHKQAVVAEDEVKKKIEEVVATMPSMEGNLLVADGDLYQLDTGTLLAKGWFKHATPLKLYLDAEAGNVISRYPNEMIKYDLAGKQVGVIGSLYGLAINEAMDSAFFAKDKDVWKAAIDPLTFKLVNEQRVTTTAGFMERFFAANIIMGTQKVIIVRNMNQLLRVDMVTGEVTSTRMPLTGLKNQRSPDGALLVGGITERTGQKFFAYDVEKDEVKTFNLDSRMKATDFAWVNPTTCAFITSLTEMGVFDREKQELRTVTKLPMQCNDMGWPSPTGRYIFCFSAFKGMVLVDLEGKKIESLGSPAQHYQWIADDVLLCARDVPDSNQRGTWVKKIGQEEVRVSTEPYSFARRGAGASVLAIKEAGIVFFATRGGMFKVKLGEDKAQMFAPLSKPLTRFVYIEKWKR